MGDISLETMAKVVAQLGFPIALCIWLLQTLKEMRKEAVTREQDLTHRLRCIEDERKDMMRDYNEVTAANTQAFTSFRHAFRDRPCQFSKELAKEDTDEFPPVSLPKGHHLPAQKDASYASRKNRTPRPE